MGSWLLTQLPNVLFLSFLILSLFNSNQKIWRQTPLELTELDNSPDLIITEHKITSTHVCVSLNNTAWKGVLSSGGGWVQVRNEVRSDGGEGNIGVVHSWNRIYIYTSWCPRRTPLALTNCQSHVTELERVYCIKPSASHRTTWKPNSRESHRQIHGRERGRKRQRQRNGGEEGVFMLNPG